MNQSEMESETPHLYKFISVLKSVALEDSKSHDCRRSHFQATHNWLEWITFQLKTMPKIEAQSDFTTECVVV